MKETKDIICGIYSITNTINGKIYIGSSKNIYRRWEEHKNLLKQNRHHSDYKISNGEIHKNIIFND